MSENEKDKTAAEKPESKPGVNPKADKVIDQKPKKTETKMDGTPAKTAPAQPNKPRPRRGGMLGGRTKPALFPVAALARRTGVDAVVLGALTIAYGWSERTRLSQAEFLRLRDAWLKRPVKEG